VLLLTGYLENREEFGDTEMPEEFTHFVKEETNAKIRSCVSAPTTC